VLRGPGHLRPTECRGNSLLTKFCHCTLATSVGHIRPTPPGGNWPPGRFAIAANRLTRLKNYLALRLALGGEGMKALTALHEICSYSRSGVPLCAERTRSTRRGWARLPRSRLPGTSDRNRASGAHEKNPWPAKELHRGLLVRSNRTSANKLSSAFRHQFIRPFQGVRASHRRMRSVAANLLPAQHAR
jgi:hypothetical protein